ELRADLERQRRVLQNAAVIQARDQEERARIIAATAPVTAEGSSLSTPQGIRAGDQGSDVLEEPQPSQIHEEPKQALGPSRSLELPPIGKDRDWQPEVLVLGSLLLFVPATLVW
ncbi:hypothetical protein BC827DRAFT_1340799, partial [Russula dissimulans]